MGAERLLEHIASTGSGKEVLLCFLPMLSMRPLNKTNMNPEDLAIFDWVLLPDDAFAQVIGIAFDGIFFKDGKGEGACSYDKIHPIPLTPEILEKNGFVNNDLPFINGWEQYGLFLYPAGDGYRINCGQNVSIVIDTVHQLQHALKLCGINKVIEL